jgi:hypothetical protein
MTGAVVMSTALDGYFGNIEVWALSANGFIRRVTSRCGKITP